MCVCVEMERALLDSLVQCLGLIVSTHLSRFFAVADDPSPPPPPPPSPPSEDAYEVLIFQSAPLFYSRFDSASEVSAGSGMLQFAPRVGSTATFMAVERSDTEPKSGGVELGRARSENANAYIRHRKDLTRL